MGAGEGSCTKLVTPTGPHAWCPRAPEFRAPCQRLWGPVGARCHSCDSFSSTHTSDHCLFPFHDLIPHSLEKFPSPFPLGSGGALSYTALLLLAPVWGCDQRPGSHNSSAPDAVGPASLMCSVSPPGPVVEEALDRCGQLATLTWQQVAYVTDTALVL